MERWCGKGRQETENLFWLRPGKAISREIRAAQHVTRPEGDGGNEGACKGEGEAQDQVSSDAEENKEDERVDVGNKESEIRQQQEDDCRSIRQVRRPERFEDFVME